eukprot:6592626-Pyramimonas_sp.AAC.1
MPNGLRFRDGSAQQGGMNLAACSAAWVARVRAHLRATAAEETSRHSPPPPPPPPPPPTCSQ